MERVTCVCPQVLWIQSYAYFKNKSFEAVKKRGRDQTMIHMNETKNHISVVVKESVKRDRFNCFTLINEMGTECNF